MTSVDAAAATCMLGRHLVSKIELAVRIYQYRNMVAVAFFGMLSGSDLRLTPAVMGLARQAGSVDKPPLALRP